MKIAGIDIGSTTVKGALVEDGKTIWRRYGRHNTRQAEKTLEMLSDMEAEAGLKAGRDRVYFTGSGANLIAPLADGRMVQEVVAVAAAVEKLHPDVRFVSEIGGEDMKTVFFAPTKAGKSKQVYMQSACSGGTGAFIEKSARKLEVAPETLAEMRYTGKTLHRISGKCGIFAEADSNSLVKAGVPVDEIIPSLFDAVVLQNLATLAKGNTPMPKVLLLGGPNMFFRGLREAWQKHLPALWTDRGVELPENATVEDLIWAPDDALYYACLGCVEIANREGDDIGVFKGVDKLRDWIDVGQYEEKKSLGKKALSGEDGELATFLKQLGEPAPPITPKPTDQPIAIGCDFGSATTKAVVMSASKELLFSCYAPSQGNPIEDAKGLFRQIREAGFETIGGLGITGYGKDLLQDLLGADTPVVETVAHATGTLHFFPDADAICDVGGCDVKIMLLSQQTVTDFRLNSQCSSGNGAFLQGVAERYNIPLEDYADHAFQAEAMPSILMGCGVFLQSDIVNQQRKGWSADEILAGLASVLPLNVWVYAGQLQNLRAAGRKFILQGGTHRNLAVIKAQFDFIREKVPEAEIVVHPYSGEAGAIGACLLAVEYMDEGKPSGFRGFSIIEGLKYKSTTNDLTTCTWCTVNCRRAFIDVELPGGKGRPWSKVPLAEGSERVITGNTCAKGLVEDSSEMRVVRKKLERTKDAYPNVAERVRETAFR